MIQKRSSGGKEQLILDGRRVVSGQKALLESQLLDVCFSNLFIKPWLVLTEGMETFSTDSWLPLLPQPPLYNE